MSTADLFVKIEAMPDDLRRQVADFVEFLLARGGKPTRSEGGAEPPKAKRPIGIMKGKIRMADDFDAPLDDFKEYME